MNLSVAWYSYQYFVRKIDEKKKRNKKYPEKTYFLSLMLVIFNFIFFFSLIFYLFELNKSFNIFNKGIPLGPIASALAFIFFALYFIIVNPKYNAAVINKMKKAYNNTKDIPRSIAIVYYITSFVLFLLSFKIISLSMK